MPDIRELSLWSFLVWCYRDQKAHLYLKRPMDWFLWRLAFDEMVEDMPRASVHPDAAQLHAAVCELPKQQAEMIVYFAEEQQQPRPPSAMPAPRPMRVDRVVGIGDGERYSQGRYQGREVQYLVRWHEQVGVAEGVFKRYGRKLKRVGTRVVKHPVEFCPIDWQPSLPWVIALGTIHANWLEAMLGLQQALAGHAFRNHAIAGSGIENAQPIDVGLLKAWRAIQERLGVEEPEVETDLSRHKFTTQDGETFYRRNARVTHV